MRSTLIGVADMKTYIDVLMRLRDPFEERILAHESTKDIFAKKTIVNKQDPKKVEANNQVQEAKERATENFLSLIKEGKYFEPHEDMAFFNSWSRLLKLDGAFKAPGYKPNKPDMDFILI